MFDQKPSTNPPSQPIDFSPPFTGPQPVPKAPPEIPLETEPTVMPRVTDIRPTDGAKGAPPQGLPTTEATEDIFKETDKVTPVPPISEGGKTPPPAGPLEPLTELPDDLEEEGGGGKKFFLVGLLVVVVILAGGGYFAYTKFFRAAPASLPEVNLNVQPEVNQNINIEPQVNENLNLEVNENLNENVNAPANLNVNKKATLDSDKDGLTDAEEEEYGTDPFEPDSDGDGLYDREEIKVYHTNPLNPDSDNDGYLDGEEVESGYNPLGPGKLLEINFEE